jgi:dephospho-CoA kinase
MRTEIFRSRASKKTLESILHPRVYAEIERRLETLDAPYAILSIPLLIETRQQARVDRILVVDCPLQLQYERVEARDRQDKKEIGRIISSQASRDERLRFADEIIVNDSSIDNLAEQVNRIHLLYVSLSSSGPKMPS